MIRDSLIRWRDITELLVRVLDVQEDDLRDGIIEQVHQLLDQREQLVPTLQGPISEEEKAFGQELLALEKELDSKLTYCYQSIRQDIEVQQKKKESVHAYLDPYSQVFRDGTFYDKRK